MLSNSLCELLHVHSVLQLLQNVVGALRQLEWKAHCVHETVQTSKRCWEEHHSQGHVTTAALHKPVQSTMLSYLHALLQLQQVFTSVLYMLYSRHSNSSLGWPTWSGHQSAWLSTRYRPWQAYDMQTQLIGTDLAFTQNHAPELVWLLLASRDTMAYRWLAAEAADLALLHVTVAGVLPREARLHVAVTEALAQAAWLHLAVLVARALGCQHGSHHLQRCRRPLPVAVHPQ